METNSNFLYCKSCKSKISKDAPTCPHCGIQDPFYFEEMKKYKGVDILHYLISFGLAFMTTGILAILPIDLERGYLMFAIFVALYVSFFVLGIILSKKVGKAKKQEYSSLMQKVCEENNDIQAYATWNNIMDSIIS